MRECGMQVCLATGFGRHTQNMVLESLGWMGLADLSLCPADAGRGRPYPDMILTALLALDLDDVREVAVIGDTSSDMLSGVRSGASLIAGVLTGSHSEATLRAAGASVVVDSIKQLPLLLEKREARHV
jgi:phosphonatase-like hydrolase